MPVKPKPGENAVGHVVVDAVHLIESGKTGDASGHQEAHHDDAVDADAGDGAAARGFEPDGPDPL